MDASITQVSQTSPSKGVSRSTSSSSSGTAFQTLLREKRQEQSFKTKKDSEDLSDAAAAQGANVQDAANTQPAEPRESTTSQNNRTEALKEDGYSLNGLRLRIKGLQGQSMLWQAGMDVPQPSADSEIPVQNFMQMQTPDTKGQMSLQTVLAQAGQDMSASKETLTDSIMNQAAQAQGTGVTQEMDKTNALNVPLSTADQSSAQKMTDLLQSVNGVQDNKQKVNGSPIHQLGHPDSMNQTSKLQGAASIQGDAANAREDGENSLLHNAGTARGIAAQTVRNTQPQEQDNTQSEVQPEQIAQPEGKVQTPVQTQTIEQAPETVQIKADNPNELIQKLMDKLIQKTAAGKQEFEVQIEPENLGKLAIKVAYEHESTVISIVCTNEKTLNLLSQGARNIAMIMENHLGTPTTIYVDKGEENYLNQYKDQQGNQQQQQQQSNQNESPSREDGYDFIQQLRLGLAGMQDEIAVM